ncbi:conserved hypothetical protein [Gluconacetobacter diazotrophicus PA1 5]|uniref:Uncharacterized protein n=2 Tax=Gluconacetobacter diazotrophicus TaxID=33996 RepID=A9H4X6_GLUDA|nr:hypothetical protein [Gluconacetobacter diazotrophicus]ACI52126.1 conserved hypothetical protein [Gluconacetobacter diazotrophicus PA1 5]MBB2156890.1 hypothetical protein [Gluconacetobacter diazotrophicus]TWB01023.1 hypothetical protein FBZ86_13017 [Gluconacetobacter diazotrophicus]CAP54261.1 hypothetical protein GDI0318 [Gluconacetobacter diazotrophicus PA1 5]
MTQPPSRNEPDMTADERHALAAAIDAYLDTDKPGMGMYGLLDRAGDAAVYDQVRGWGCQPHPAETSAAMIARLIPPEDLAHLAAAAGVSEQAVVRYLLVHLPRAVRGFVLALPMRRPADIQGRARQHFPCIATSGVKG